jgi:hypothetical protein
MPRDFLAGDTPLESDAYKLAPRDFLAEDESPKEGLGTSLLMAIPRIGEDVIKGGYNFIKNIPEHLESAKTEIPGMLNPLANPLSRGKQALAGVSELGQRTFNTPHDILNYAANRLNLFPKEWNEKVQMGRMPDEETLQQINQTFGEPKAPGEALIRGSIKHLPELLGGAKLGQRALTTKNSLAKTLFASHDPLEKRAIKGFEEVSKKYHERQLPNVKVDSNLINSLDDYFPKTKQAKELLNKASSGDYDALRDIQSDLYTSGKDNLRSPLETERHRGAEMFEKREEINKSISDHLKNLKQHDLDEILTQSRKDYKTLKDIYYNPHMNNAIKKMVDQNIRKKPRNLLNILSEESKPMKQLIDFHPGLQEQIRALMFRNKLSSPFIKYGLPVGAGVLGYQGMKYGDSNK